jgi:hypothetical protein
MQSCRLYILYYQHFLEISLLPGMYPWAGVIRGVKLSLYKGVQQLAHGSSRLEVWGAGWGARLKTPVRTAFYRIGVYNQIGDLLPFLTMLKKNLISSIGFFKKNALFFHRNAGVSYLVCPFFR